MGDLRHAQHVGDLVDQRQLAAEQVGGCLPLRLVLGVTLGTKGLLRTVPGDCDGIGLLLTEQLDDHRGEAVHRIGHLTARRRQVGGEGEEGAVRQVVAVEQGQGGHCRRW